MSALRAARCVSVLRGNERGMADDVAENHFATGLGQGVGLKIKTLICGGNPSVADEHGATISHQRLKS